MHRLSKTLRTVIAAGLAVAGSARADLLNWSNVSGGSAASAGNWSPSQLPVSTDDLVFNIAGTYNVTFPVQVLSSHSHLYRKGTVNLTAASTHSVSSGMTVGSSNGDSATLTLASGTLSAGGVNVLGNASGSVGTINVNTSASDLLFGGNLFVGQSGTGNLNVTNLGHVQVSGAFFPGSLSSGIGTTLVSGANLSFPFGNSVFEVLSSSESRLGQQGDSNFTVSNGALASFAGPLILAHLSTSTSTVTVQTAGLVDARLTVAGDMLVGRNTIAGVAAGVGILNANAGSTVTVGGALLVGGDPDGGTGTLHITGDGVVTAHDVTIASTGSLNLNDGSLIVNGGTFSHAAAPVVVSDAAGAPEIILQNGASALLPSAGVAANFRALTVGGPGAAADGSFRVQSGSDVSWGGASSAVIVIAENTDDHGELDVDGAGSTFTAKNPTAGTLIVGADGAGRLEVTNGASLTAGTVSMATGPGSFSAAFIQDPGSIMTVNKDLFVGGSVTGPGNVAQLFIRNGGLVNVTDNTVSTVVYTQGLISLDSSTFQSVGSITAVDGSIALDHDSVLTAIQVSLDSAQLGGDGVVDARFSMINGSLLSVGPSFAPATPQQLFIGDATSVAGFSSSANSIVQVRTGCDLHILDADAATAGIVINEGGTITAANGLRLLAAAAVSGNGLIDADVSFILGGSITPDATGLRFGGVLTRTGGTISGGLIGFNSGGGYTGGGVIASVVDADAGSVITATSNLQLGANSAFGVTLDGVLHCGAFDVTLIDSNGLALGTLTDIAAGGSVNCAQNLIVNTGRILEGLGDVTTPNLTIIGTLKPGDTQASGIGTARLDINGNIIFGSANANYICQLAPFDDVTTHDRIQVSGNATLTGNLTVGLVPNYTPSAHDVFTIVSAANVTGKFSTETLPSGGAFGPVHVIYTPTKVNVVMCYANCDGSAGTPVITANDFQCFIDRFAAGDSYANCDGSTGTPRLTSNDFQCFINKVAGGCP